MARRPARALLVAAGIAAGAAVAVAATMFMGFLPHRATSAVPVSWQRPAVSGADLVQKGGVRLVRLSVSGDGGLLDLRYQVIDPDKAAALHAAGTPPAIVDESSGLVLDQLLMGHSHNGPMKPAVTYYLVFDNPGGWVHRGSRVAVLLGGVQVDHVRVA